MRKLLRKMKRERMKRLSRSVVTVGLAAGLVAGGYLATCGQAQAFESHTTVVQAMVESSTTTIGSKTRSLNLAIMGIDELGNVATDAESGGSEIVAAVRTNLGNITLGAGWGSGTNPSWANEGSFASDTKYIALHQGVGSVNIQYPNTVAGTDVISVTLYEVRSQYGGTAETREIASKTLTVEAASAASSAGVLDISYFTSPLMSTPPHVPNENTASPGIGNDPELGISGSMVAGTGATLHIVALKKVGKEGEYKFDPNKEGTVKVTLVGNNNPEIIGGNKSDKAYPAITETMRNGYADVDLPASYTKAGIYTVVATMDDGSLTSVIQDADVTNPAGPSTDFITIQPKAEPKGLKLTSNMTIVNDNTNGLYASGAEGRDTLTVSVLDEYGNKVDPTGVSSFDVTIDDSKNLMTCNAPVAGGSCSGGPGSEKYTFPGSVNTASYFAQTATITTAGEDSTLTAKASGLTSSAPVSVKIVQDGLDITAVGDFSNNINKAGFTWDLFSGATGTGFKAISGANLTGGDSFVVTNLAKKEESPVSQAVLTSATTGNLAVSFKKATTNGELTAKGFLIHHVAGTLADVVAKPTSSVNIEVATDIPVSAEFKTDIFNGGVYLSKPVAYFPTPGSSKSELKIDLLQLEAKDAFGNIVATANQGRVKIASTKGTVSNSDWLNYGPGGAQVTVAYDEEDVGTDDITFTFEKSSITKFNDADDKKITVTLPTFGALDSFAFSIPGNEVTIPTNSRLPVDIYPLTADGKLTKVASGYKVDFPNGITLYEPSSPTTDWAGTEIHSGQNSGVAASTWPLMVEAGPNAGSYDLTVKSIDNSKTGTLTIKVKEFTNPLSLETTAVTVAPGSTGDVNIIGGKSPYTVTSADESVVTATVSGNKLTLTAVAQGGPVDVTVTDANDATAVAKVTVADSGVVPPLGDAGSMNADGSAATTATTFSGGVSVAGSSYNSSATVAQDTTLDIKVTATIDPADVGKKADMIVLAGIKIGDTMSWFMKPATAGAPWPQWFGDPAALVGYNTVDAMASEETINVFNGALTGFAGMQVQVFTAYRLEDGKVVYNQQPVIINVTE